MTIIQCTTSGVVTAAERLCRSLDHDAADMGFEGIRMRPTVPLLIQIAEHPGVEGEPQLWYSVGQDGKQHDGWVCDVYSNLGGAIVYVEADDLS